MALAAEAVNDTDFGVSLFLPFKVKLAKLIGWVRHASTPTPPRGTCIGSNVCCSTRKNVCYYLLSGNNAAFYSLHKVVNLGPNDTCLPNCSIPTCPFIPKIVQSDLFKSFYFGVRFYD